MYRQTFQRPYFSIFYSAGLDPLRNWLVHRRDGYIKRIYDPDTGILVMEMRALNVTLHYIASPRDPKQTLGIRLPIFNLLIKNLNKCFSFEVKILDDNRMYRRFRCGNFLRYSSIQLFETTIPLSMMGNDWVLIYFNLAEFTRRCYNTSYVETSRVQINGNIHLRRVFFSEQVIEYCQLPKDYQITIAETKPQKPMPSARPPSPANYKGQSIQQRKSGALKAAARGSRSPKAPGSPKSVASVILVSIDQLATGDNEMPIEQAIKAPSKEVIIQEPPEVTGVTTEIKDVTAEAPEVVAEVTDLTASPTPIITEPPDNVAEELPPADSAKQASKEVVEQVEEVVNPQETE